MSHQSQSNNVVFPLLPLRGYTLQPGVTTCLFIGTVGYQNAVRAASSSPHQVFAVTRIDENNVVHEIKDLYSIGTVATVDSQRLLPDGNLMIQVSGCYRGRVVEFIGATGYTAVAIEPVSDAESHLREMGPASTPVRLKGDAPDDIIESISLEGFDPVGGPTVDRERSGGLWLMFEQMPPSWVPRAEYSDFGRCATFDVELQQAIGADVLWDDRERFYIERPTGDCIERIQAFLVGYRARNEPPTDS